MQKFIWATYIINAETNLLGYILEDSEEALYIHAFDGDDDEDGAGYHLTEKGAVLEMRPTYHHEIQNTGEVRLVLMIPAGDLAENKDAIFSPSELGGVEAEEFGMGTAEEIETRIAELEQAIIGN